MAFVYILLFVTKVYFISPICARQTAACLNNTQCIPISDCYLKNSNEFIYPCDNADKVCCPVRTSQQDLQKIEMKNPRPIQSLNAGNDVEIRAKLFSKTCGFASSTDKIISGKKAALGQFPWMALLGFKYRGENVPIQFNCGGSIISEYFILSAAHCMVRNSPSELVVVRLGEFNLTSDIDCEKIELNKDYCADKPVEIGVSRVFLHKQYDDKILKNDIALVKLRSKVTETTFIRPICLPFHIQKLKTHSALENKKYLVSGWGKTSTDNLGGSNVLQFTTVTTWKYATCNQSLLSSAKPPIEFTQICANGAQDEDACKGDSGGPLFNVTNDKNGEARYFQIGIVSYKSSQSCGDPNVPTVYTRVDRYLDWIVQNML